MTITDANDINKVLRHLLNVKKGMHLPEHDKQAKEAAVRLADRANKALGAGLTGEGIRKEWT